MTSFLVLLLHALASPFKLQARLEAEIVFLRHQLNLLRRRLPAKPRLTAADRLRFVRLYRLVPSLLNAAVIIQPDTIVQWHRAGFRSYWRWKSRSRRSGPHRFTEKQGQYLAFIYVYKRMFGQAPAEADMQRHFRVSPPSVHHMVLSLGRDGPIRRQIGVARSIDVLVPHHDLLILDWLRINSSKPL